MEEEGREGQIQSMAIGGEEDIFEDAREEEVEVMMTELEAWCDQQENEATEEEGNQKGEEMKNPDRME